MPVNSDRSTLCSFGGCGQQLIQRRSAQAVDVGRGSIDSCLKEYMDRVFIGGGVN